MPAVDKDATGQPYAGKGLDREVIVRAALDSIDRRGAQGLTMRSLAQDLGVEAMSLYRYVAGREDLLEAIVTLLLEDLSNIDEQLGQTWQGYLQGLAHAVRRIAVEHPAAFPLVATRHPAAPWLRPPLRSLELVEDFLSTLSEFGLSDEQVVNTYQAFSGFLLGNLLLEAAMRGAETSPIEEPLDEGNATVPSRDGQVDLSQNPTVARFQPLLSKDRSAEEFETSLETLLDRLEMELSQ
jgi:TetR/AcrR family tetracycline transcriptional repressor